MLNNYTETELQLIINKITESQASTITMNEGELYLSPDTAVYSVNNVTPTNGNVNIPEGANKDLSNLSSTGNAKFQAPVTGGASTITSSNLTTNRALVSNSSGKVAVSSVTLSELGYMSGVTSNIQTQLNNKADVDLSNINIIGKQVIATNSALSATKYVDITPIVGSGNTYVSHVNGVVCFCAGVGTSTWCQLSSIDFSDTNQILFASGNIGTLFYTLLPIYKGQKYKLNYDGNIGSTILFREISFEGGTIN